MTTDVDSNDLSVNPDHIVEYDDGSRFTEEEREQYGQKVQKRIGKLTGELRTTQQQLAEERAQKALLEQQLQEKSVLEERLKKYEEQNSSQLDDLIKSKNAARLEAMESGEFAEALQIEEEVQALREQKLTNRDKPQPAPKTEQQPVQKPYTPTKAEQAWYDANPWFDRLNTKPSAAEKRAYDVFGELTKEGFSVDDPDTFVELSKRLAGGNSGYQEYKPTQQQRERMPTQPSPRRSTGEIDPPKGAQFTQRDAQIMRNFGQNPDDAKQRANYLVEKYQGGAV